MKEQELNTIMSVVTDPINNVYKLDSRHDIEEIQRMCRIFEISKNQEIKQFPYSKIKIKKQWLLFLILAVTQ